jgi:hypothetical protein
MDEEKKLASEVDEQALKDFLQHNKNVYISLLKNTLEAVEGSPLEVFGKMISEKKHFRSMMIAGVYCFNLCLYQDVANPSTDGKSGEKLPSTA